MYKLKYLKQNYTKTLTSLLLTSGVLFLLWSCVKQEESTTTYFAGKIKNPKDDYVFFLKNDVVIDSALINAHNKFKFELDSITTGLYTFKHGPEYQYLYLEPQDSLLLYLNTWDFDESLVFSGKGGSKNNYLINLYLSQERNEKAFRPNYKLNEEEFDKAMAKNVAKQLAIYNELVESEEEEISPFFEKLAMTGIYYPYYYMKEYYPFYHKKMNNLKAFPEVDESFYDYRKQIDLNDASLMSYGPYLTYLNTYLRNQAWVMKMNNPEMHNLDLNFMKITNNKIKIESERNKLLAKGAWNALVYDDISQSDRDTVLNYFYTHCNDGMIREGIKTAVWQKEQMAAGDQLPEIQVVNFNNNQVELNNLIPQGKIGVVYFWPNDLMKIEQVAEKLKYISKSHPDVVFIGVDRDKNPAKLDKLIKEKNLDKNTQIKITKESDYYAWFSGDHDRAFVVDQKGVVKNSYMFFTDKYFEHLIKELEK